MAADTHTHAHRKTVTIYTDGACSGNPGPGGYGAILMFNGTARELSAGYKSTTNNRMELRGVIAALRALKEPCTVDLYTDSRYIVDAIDQGWAERWRRNNWMRNKKDPALNPDLWATLLELLRTHRVTFHWTRGHAGDPLNERCDELAVAATKGPDLLADTREPMPRSRP